MCMWFEAVKSGTVLRVEVTVVQGLDNQRYWREDNVEADTMRPEVAVITTKPLCL